MTIIFNDLDKNLPVAVAMSGGVDSSVAASLLAEAGFRVIGLTMQLYDHGMAVGKKGACCAGQDIYDARMVADRMNFPHYVLDYESIFRQSVIEDFADSYLRGETPIPCVACNQTVKFQDLLNKARALGCQAMVTGHYIRRIIGPAGAELHQATDPRKDQSYFLFNTTPTQLDFLRFPLGGMTKEETRAQAQRLGLDIAEKPDSQDICFVPDGNYASVVAKLRPKAVTVGEVVDQVGNVLGHHSGIVHYTIGQRKGLGIAAAEPLYVLALEPDTNRVVVGPREALARTQIPMRDFNILAPDVLKDGAAVSVKIRSSMPPIPATFHYDTDEPYVMLQVPEYGISPGQACVLYKGTRLLGGGWIV